MTNVVIEPFRDKGDPQLPATGLLVINPAEAKLAAGSAGAWRAESHFLFNSRLFVFPEEAVGKAFFLAGPAVGAPMAVLTLEKLIALGAAQVVVVGWCGSLSPNLAIGDVLLPTLGVSEEGTSPHYPYGHPVEADPHLQNELKSALGDHGFQVHTGPIWTTDAPYRETREKVNAYRQQGVLGVDMEFSALSTVAAFRGISLAAALLVSDEPWKNRWEPGYRRKAFRKKIKVLYDALLAAVRQEKGIEKKSDDTEAE